MNINDALQPLARVIKCERTDSGLVVTAELTEYGKRIRDEIRQAKEILPPDPDQRVKAE